MKKLTLLIILFSLTLGLFAQPNKRFLRTKAYFSSIFSVDDISLLNSAEVSKIKANKYFDKSDKYYKIADGYMKKSELPIASAKRYKRKAHKYELKGAKYSIKANKIVLDADKITNKVYVSNLNLLKTSKENSAIIKSLKAITKKYTDSSLTAKAKISTASEIDKANLMNDVAYFEDKAFLFMEYQFAVFRGDKKLTAILSKKYIKPDTTSKKKIKYDISKDKYLFHSKNEKIDEIISYSSSEEEMFKQYYLLGQKGFALMQKAKIYDDTIKKLNLLIQKTSDFMKKRTLIQQKKQIENNQLFQKISSINNYYDANEKYYQLRQNHIKDYLPNDTTTKLYNKIIHYTKLSEDFYKDSKRYKKISVQKGNQDKYTALLAANDQLISSLYFQENAFNLMFRKDTNTVVIKHKLPSNINKNKTSKNKQNKNKNKSKNKTKNKNKTHKIKKPAVNRITGIFVYSYEKPKPKPAYTQRGTIYRVQVGTSRYLLPVNELREYDKIYYETMSGTNVKKFLVGDYRDLDNARNTLNNLKAKGYTNAYIVKYVGGKRTKAIYASTYRQNRNADNPKFNAINISSTKYLNYFVQIGTFSTAKSKKDLKTTKRLYYKQLSDGRIQYFEGPYFHYSDVSYKLKKVKQNGFSDAFIVAFNNGRKMALTKARKIEQNVNKKNQVIFRIQVGAFSKRLSQEEIDKKFGKLRDIYFLHTYKYKNLTVYSFGEAKTFSEAKKLRQTADNLGFTDSFIIAVKSGKLIPISSVIK